MREWGGLRSVRRERKRKARAGESARRHPTRSGGKNGGGRSNQPGVGSFLQILRFQGYGMLCSAFLCGVKSEDAWGTLCPFLVCKSYMSPCIEVQDKAYPTNGRPSFGEALPTRASRDVRLSTYATLKTLPPFCFSSGLGHHNASQLSWGNPFTWSFASIWGSQSTSVEEEE